MVFKFSSIKLGLHSSDNNFKCLSQEFSGEQLKLVKQKGVYLYEYTDSFNFFKDKLPDRWEFYSSLKDDVLVKIFFLHAIDVWNVFKMNTMVIMVIFI